MDTSSLNVGDIIIYTHENFNEYVGDGSDKKISTVLLRGVVERNGDRLVVKALPTTCGHTDSISMFWGGCVYYTPIDDRMTFVRDQDGSKWAKLLTQKPFEKEYEEFREMERKVTLAERSLKRKFHEYIMEVFKE